MDVYYCLIQMPGNATPELDVLEASSLSEAFASLSRIRRQWPGLEEVELYCCNDLIDRYHVDQLHASAVAA